MLRRALVLSLFLAAACSKAESQTSQKSTEGSVEKGGATAGTADKVMAGTGATAGTAAAVVTPEPVKTEIKPETKTEPETQTGPGTGKGTGTKEPIAKEEPVASGKGETIEAGDPADTSYKFVIEAPGAVKAGSAATARLRITPGTGYKMNHDFPTKVTLETVDGVTYAAATIDKGKAETFTDHELVFAVQATPTAAGEYTVKGKVKFAVCTDATCDPKTRPVSFRLAAN